MKKVFLGLLMAGVILSWTGQSWAPTAIATAALSATVSDRFTVALQKDATGSVCSSPAVIVFDKIDGDDVGVDNPDPGYMYAPYRSYVNKNWHVVSIAATKTGDVTLKVDTTLPPAVKNNLKVWFGGFYTSGSTTPVGTKSTTWDAMGSTKVVPGPFTGTCPLNYQLKITDLAAQTYTGTITFTITQS